MRQLYAHTIGDKREQDKPEPFLGNVPFLANILNGIRRSINCKRWALIIMTKLATKNARFYETSTENAILLQAAFHVDYFD